MEPLWDQSVREKREKPVAPYRNVIMRQPPLQQQASRAPSSVLAISPNDEKRLQSHELSVLHYIDSHLIFSAGIRPDALCVSVWSGLHYFCENRLFNDLYSCEDILAVPRSEMS